MEAGMEASFTASHVCSWPHEGRCPDHNAFRQGCITRSATASRSRYPKGIKAAGNLNHMARPGPAHACAALEQARGLGPKIALS